VPAVITPGDTVSGETIERFGDIDVFTLSGTAGQQFNVFLQSFAPSPGLVGTDLVVIDPSGNLLDGTQGLDSTVDLLLNSTGRFTLPVTGTYEIWLQGMPGAYRFFVYPVSRAPESASATLAFGDSVTTEAMDVSGDVDTFTVVVAASGNAKLALELGSDAIEGAVDAYLVRSGTGGQLATISSYTPGQRNETGTFPLGAGTYVLRVENPSLPRVGAGSYRVVLQPVP
jgi:hypothetical protein